LETLDQDIIAGVLAGDRERFGDLVQRHGGPLWGSLRQSMSNLEDAREVFQETWVRALERLDTLQDPRRLRSWLLSIAFNLVRHGQRRRGLILGAAEGQLEAAADEEQAEPGAAILRHEEEGQLKVHIERLPNRQREVLDLRLNQELSHAQIGELLGITAEASRANYYQALRKLRALSQDPDEGYINE
jgi:RNA polymerase sigma factor (sigma-70 family)